MIKGIKNTFYDYYEFYLIRKVIQNTLFAKFESTDKNILHASSLANDKNSTLLFGLGGVGKTTLALSLVCDCHLKLQGDNFILTDGKHSFSYFEPTRITKYTNDKINMKLITVKKNMKTFGKYNFYIMDKFLSQDKLKIKNIVFPVISDKLKLKRISKAKAVVYMENSMSCLKETPQFSEINYIFKKKDINFSNDINFYFLYYKKLEDAKNILKKIL
jgi:hypothetical protein